MGNVCTYQTNTAVTPWKASEAPSAPSHTSRTRTSVFGSRRYIARKVTKTKAGDMNSDARAQKSWLKYHPSGSR